MRCIHEPHKIPRDFATWLPPSRLAALRHKEAHIGRLGRQVSTYELIGNASWQNPGRSTYPSRGVLDHRLRTGDAMQYSMGSTAAKRRRFQTTCRTLGLWRYNLAKAEFFLGKARTRLDAVSNLLAPHLLGMLASLGRSGEGLVFKMQSHTKMDVQQLGENPRTLPVSHKGSNWSSTCVDAQWTVSVRQ